MGTIRDSDDDDGETQALETDFAPSGVGRADHASAHGHGSKMPLDETLFLEDEPLFQSEFAREAPNLYGETQVVDDSTCVAAYHGRDDQWVDTLLVDGHEGMNDVDGDSPCVGDRRGWDNQWLDTLLVDGHEGMDDVDGDEDNKTMGTQVLIDDGEQFDDGASPFEIDNDDIERKIKDDPLGQQRMIASPSPCLDDHGKNANCVDSDASTDEEGASGHNGSKSLCNGSSFKPNPGSLRRSFTTVRTASLRASGLAAARSLTPKRAVKPSIDNDSHSSKHQDSPITAQVSLQECKEDIGITSKGGPTPLPCIEVREQQLECESGSQTNLHYGMNETKIKVRNPEIRKLFNADKVAQKEECMNEIDRKKESHVHHNTISGLSYVSSQEPGEHSQTNALDIVDRFLAINDVDLSPQEAVPEETRQVKPTTHLGAKAANSLAIKVGQRSLIGKSGIFEWVDSLEDECGGEFFSKRKRSFFERTDRVKASHSEPFKARQHNHRKRFSKVGEKESINHKDHSEVKNLTRSDSRLQLGSSITSDRLQTIQISCKKNLFKDVDIQSNANSMQWQPEAADIGTCMEDIGDVGPDTQLAAEAMEVLFCGPPVDLQSGEALPVTGNTGEDPFQIVVEKQAPSKHVTLRKRTSASDSKCSRRQCKKRKMPGVKSCREKSSTISVKHVGKLRVKKDLGKGSKGMINEWEQCKTDTCNPSNGNELSEGKLSLSIGREKNRRKKDGKPYKSFKREKERGKLDRIHMEELGSCIDPSISTGTLPVDKEHMQEKHLVSATPVAHRTRQSKTKKTSECPEALSNYKGQYINDAMEISTMGTKSRHEIYAYAAGDPGELTNPEKLLNSGSKQLGEPGKNVRGQQLLDLKGMHEARGMNCLIKDASTHPKKRRTRQNRSGNLNVGSSNEEAVEVNKQCSAQHMSKVLVVTSPLKRKPQNVGHLVSEVQGMPFNNKNVSDASGVKIRSSMRKQACGQSCNENLTGQIFLEPSSSRDDSSAALKTDNFPPKASCPSVANMCHVVTQGAHATIHVKDTRLVSSTEEKVQPPCSTTTATSENFLESPVCTSVDPLKLGKDGIGSSRLSIRRELIRLMETEAAPVSLKDSRRRRDITSVRVLLSHHLGDGVIKQQKKILARLGVSIASSISDATHFIADKFARTRNMLEAIAMGKPVVTHLWLENCGQANCLIDEKNHILRDLKKEKEIGFSMPASLARACQSPLLQGRRVYITPTTKPDRELIASLVTAACGEPTKRLGRSAVKDDKVPDNLLIISCEEDYSICTPLLAKGAEVFGSELILNGIIIQRLEYERHRLFMNNIKKTRSTIWLKSENCSQFVPVNKRT